MESFTFGFASPISAAESGEICAAESGEISAAESGEISPLFEESPKTTGDARDGAHHCAQDGAQDGPNPSYEDDRPAAAATERCPERATERSVYLLFAFNHVGAAPLPAHLMASDDTAHCP